ncbi:MAG: very short patch repair endonuclease [Anaerolineae bacterium]
MPDNLTPEQRRYCMSRVKGKDTGIEQRVRSALHRRGLRFRKHLTDLPGKPDVVFTRAKVAVFVDGDFWHGYDFASWQDKVSDFWKVKIGKSVERDEANNRKLGELGWTVIRIWQHEVKHDLDACVEQVVQAVRARQALR